jgi:hypothetical protein
VDVLIISCHFCMAPTSIPAPEARTLADLPWRARGQYLPWRARARGYIYDSSCMVRWTRTANHYARASAPSSIPPSAPLVRWTRTANHCARASAPSSIPPSAPHLELDSWRSALKQQAALAAFLGASSSHVAWGGILLGGLVALGSGQVECRCAQCLVALGSLQPPEPTHYPDCQFWLATLGISRMFPKRWPCNPRRREVLLALQSSKALEGLVAVQQSLSGLLARGFSEWLLS